LTLVKWTGVSIFGKGRTQEKFKAAIFLTIPTYKSINRHNMSKSNPAVAFEAKAKRLPTSERSIVGIVGLRWLIGKT
jgi:hypothetical protein